MRAPWKFVAAAALCAGLLGGCAWTDRENRPTWNAFEEHLVPEDPTWFWVSTPLTVPGGLIAILLDVFLVHPFTTIDDAWDDGLDIWDGADWAEDYYSEVALSVLRVPGTAVVFVGSFLSRSMFVQDDHHPESGGAVTKPVDEAALEAEALAWLEALADAEGELPAGPVHFPETWPLEEAVHTVLAEGRAAARLAVRSHQSVRGIFASDPVALWADDDPRVRVALACNPMFLHWARGPGREALREAMLADPDPVVREALHLRRFGP